MISTKDANFLKLIERSPDSGNGWRSVSDACWPLLMDFGLKELIEIDHDRRTVRLTSDGIAIVRFAL